MPAPADRNDDAAPNRDAHRDERRDGDRDDVGPARPPGFPRAFGPYRLLAPLAQGGMGEVFLATRTSAITGAVRLLVVKTLRPDLAREKGYVGRFLDEARVALQLAHGNIAQVFDAGAHDGVSFIAMEHVAGVTLRHLVEAAPRGIPPEIALLLVSDVLDGLDAAHRHAHPLTGEPLCIVHRDISPHNVMLTFDGDVKIIDFGLAESRLKQEHTESNVVLGKIAYMSPEQARGDDVEAKSDQYSAAVVLYELLTGDRFYGDRTHHDIWLVAGDPPPPRRLAHVDEGLRRLLAIALAKHPADRWPSCGTFATALRSFIHERFPAADRALLRAFVSSTSRAERADLERTLRALAPLIHAPPLLEAPTLATPAPLAPIAPIAPAAAFDDDASLLARAGLSSMKRRAAIAAAITAAIGVGALVAVGIAFATAQPTHDAVVVAPVDPTPPPLARITPPAPSPIHVEAPANVAPLAPTPPPPPTTTTTTTTITTPITHSHARAAVEAPQVAPATSETTAEIAPTITNDATQSADDAHEKSTTVASEPKADGGGSIEEKWQKLELSNATCARALRKLHASGAIVAGATLDACLAVVSGS